MVLKVSNPNNVKIYTVSGSNLTRKIPEWLARSKKQLLKKDREWQTRIELIQDFEFPEAANRIKITPDGQFCMATGVYKPQMRVFEFSQMSKKFERHTDSENIDFLILSEDWTKSVHLQNDRSIEFHDSGSLHYKTRIPKFGRDLAYHKQSCDLLLASAGNEVYRLNLDQGRFLKPFEVDSTGVNSCAINPAHQLFAFGTESGTVEFWDPRSKAKIGTLQQYIDQSNPNSSEYEVSALSYRNDGLNIAVGTSTGLTMVYDLRLSHPSLVKDQQYGLPIKKLTWIEPSLVNATGDDVESDYARILSADSKSAKIWNSNSGKLHCTIEPTADINDITICQDTGLIFAACESTEINGYFIPSLGPAPKWAGFLENLTEELEESASVTVYEDYKFITPDELESLSLGHLVGTSLLKPYMHGFFIDLKLYNKAKAVANPFAYEEYKSNLIRNKILKQRESRIRTMPNNQALPKVNRKLAMRLLEKDDVDSNSKKNKSSKGTVPANDSNVGSRLLANDRFKGLFDNPEFEVDENSTEYKLLHPTESKKSRDHRQNRYSDDSSDEN
ncbi:Ribosome biogenesis protein enp2-like protein [Smittium culicis]|uniref:Ribosome biogenesis protein enp2-like protein n=2 Tax=Smittium culicis TaxID=133412 RepID=A0A1R1XY37_9FUNG|nr:Ribosome biogenesis protein enp2-like protein [Smittium culicis]